MTFTAKGWGCYEHYHVGIHERHVIPMNDSRDHMTDNLCWCHPRDDEGVWVHNSADGREASEQQQRTPA